MSELEKVEPTAFDDDHVANLRASLDHQCGEMCAIKGRSDFHRVARGLIVYFDRERRIVGLRLTAIRSLASGTDGKNLTDAQRLDAILKIVEER